MAGEYNNLSRGERARVNSQILSLFETNPEFLTEFRNTVTANLNAQTASDPFQTTLDGVRDALAPHASDFPRLDSSNVTADLGIMSEALRQVRGLIRNEHDPRNNGSLYPQERTNGVPSYAGIVNQAFIAAEQRGSNLRPSHIIDPPLDYLRSIQNELGFPPPIRDNFSWPETPLSEIVAIHYQDARNNHDNDPDVLMDNLIKESTQNGVLDLNRLAAFQSEAAEQLARNDASYDRQPSDVRQHHFDRLQVSTLEMLGLHDRVEQRPSHLLNGFGIGRAEHEPTNGLVARMEGVEVTMDSEGFDPNVSLREQGIRATKETGGRE